MRFHVHVGPRKEMIGNGGPPWCSCFEQWTIDV